MVKISNALYWKLSTLILIVVIIAGIVPLHSKAEASSQYRFWIGNGWSVESDSFTDGNVSVTFKGVDNTIDLSSNEWITTFLINVAYGPDTDTNSWIQFGIVFREGSSPGFNLQQNNRTNGGERDYGTIENGRMWLSFAPVSYVIGHTYSAELTVNKGNNTVAFLLTDKNTSKKWSVTMSVESTDIVYSDGGYTDGGVFSPAITVEGLLNTGKTNITGFPYFEVDVENHLSYDHPFTRARTESGVSTTAPSGIYSYITGMFDEGYWRWIACSSPSTMIPQPQVVTSLLTYPESIAAGDTATIDIPVQNVGASGQVIIQISFPDLTGSNLTIDHIGTTIGSAELYDTGYNAPRRYGFAGCSRINTQYPFVEGVGYLYYGDIKHLKVKVTPDEPGDFKFYVKTVGFHDWSAVSWDPDIICSLLYPDEILLDQQEEWGYSYTFTVTDDDSLPTITSVNPVQGRQGETIVATINGTGFTADSSLSYGPGIKINSSTVSSSTKIIANITVETSASTGSRDVSVTTPGGTANLSGSFTVIQDPPTKVILFSKTYDLDFYSNTNDKVTVGTHSVTIRVLGPEEIAASTPFNLEVEVLPEGYDAQNTYEPWGIDKAKISVITPDDKVILSGIPTQENFQNRLNIEPGYWVDAELSDPFWRAIGSLTEFTLESIISYTPYLSTAYGLVQLFKDITDSIVDDDLNISEDELWKLYSFENDYDIYEVPFNRSGSSPGVTAACRYSIPIVLSDTQAEIDIQLDALSLIAYGFGTSQTYKFENPNTIRIDVGNGYGYELNNEIDYDVPVSVNQTPMIIYNPGCIVFLQSWDGENYSHESTKPAMVRIWGPANVLPNEPFNLIVEILPDQYDYVHDSIYYVPPDDLELVSGVISVISPDDKVNLVGIPIQNNYCRLDGASGDWHSSIPVNSSWNWDSDYFFTIVKDLLGFIPHIGDALGKAERSVKTKIDITQVIEEWNDFQENKDKDDEYKDYYQEKQWELYDFINQYDKYEIIDSPSNTELGMRTATKYIIPMMVSDINSTIDVYIEEFIVEGYKLEQPLLVSLNMASQMTTENEILAQQIISPDNPATIKTDDDKIVIEFPQGSVVDSTVVTISEWSQAGTPSCPSGFKVGATCFTVEMTEDLVPGTTVTLTVKYSDADLEACGGDASLLALSRYDEDIGDWIVLTTTVDTAAKTLTATTDQFSTWMIMVEDSDNPDPILSDEEIPLWILLAAVAGGLLVLLIISSVIIVVRRKTAS